MSKAKSHDKHLGAISELRACAYLLELGYEVFRNVSAHGTIDLIGIKNGNVDYFDVKTVGLKTNGEPHPPTLTAEQHRIGVKPLAVLQDGSVREISPARLLEEIRCVRCQKAFLPRRALQQFCTIDCRSARDRASGMPQSASTSC